MHATTFVPHLRRPVTTSMLADLSPLKHGAECMIVSGFWCKCPANVQGSQQCSHCRLPPRTHNTLALYCLQFCPTTLLPCTACSPAPQHSCLPRTACSPATSSRCGGVWVVMPPVCPPSRCRAPQEPWPPTGAGIYCRRRSRSCSSACPLPAPWPPTGGRCCWSRSSSGWFWEA